MKTALLALRYTKGEQRAKVMALTIFCATMALVLTHAIIVALTWQKITFDRFISHIALMEGWTDEGIKVADDATYLIFLTKRLCWWTGLVIFSIAALVWLFIRRFKPLLAVCLQDEKPNGRRLFYPHINHGHNVEDFVHKIRHETVEYLGFFDANGAKLYEQTCLSSVCVQMKDSDENFVIEHGGVVVVHNHPCSKNPFSLEDLNAMLVLRCKLAILIANGRVFIMEIPATAWGKHKKELKRIFYQLGSEKVSPVGINQAAADKFGMTFTEMSYRQFRKACRENTLRSRKQRQLA